MKSFIRFLVFSNIWVAFCVLALALSSELFLETSNYQISKFIFFATIFTYNFQRVVRVKRGSNHVRKQWLVEKRELFTLLCLSLRDNEWVLLFSISSFYSNCNCIFRSYSHYFILLA